MSILSSVFQKGNKKDSSLDSSTSHCEAMSNVWFRANVKCKVNKKAIIKLLRYTSALSQHLDQRCWKVRNNQDMTSEKLQILHKVFCVKRQEKTEIAVSSERGNHFFWKKERPKCKSENVKQSKHETKQSEKQTIIGKKLYGFSMKTFCRQLIKIF